MKKPINSHYARFDHFLNRNWSCNYITLALEVEVPKFNLPIYAKDYNTTVTVTNKIWRQRQHIKLALL